MNMKRTVSAIIALAVLAAVQGCGSRNAGQGGTSAQKPAVSVVTAQKEDVAHVSTYSSKVEAKVVNNIAPQSAMRIVRLNAEVGDYVTAGTVLAEMDSISLQKARLQMVNDDNEYRRSKELYDVGGLSKSDLEMMELAASISKSTYENLRENTVLTAPVNGYVSARNYDAGDMFSMGQPIYVLEQVIPVKLKINVSEGDFRYIRQGMPVNISVDSYPGEEFAGKVSLIYPTIDPATHTFAVEVEVRNTDRRLRPGMFARVDVLFGTERNIVLPDNAVIKQQGSGERFVYIVREGNVAEYVKVVPGIRMGDRYEILGGVEEGDIVVTKGQNRLKSGVEVTINNN